MKYIEPVFRPPAEAESLIFQVAYGCPHNQCRFCGMYKTVRYRLRHEREVFSEIDEACRHDPDTRRIFLADGDVMALPFERLCRYLEAINQAFPKLTRVNVYANGSSIANKSTRELTVLRQLKLNTLYVGLESGSQSVLDIFNKTETVETMIAAVIAARKLGFKCSVMILLGLGGQALREEHISLTAAALNRMQPQLLAALRYIQLPGLSPPANYVSITEYEAIEELRDIIANLALEHTVFRANHTSNPLPLAGRLSRDRATLLHKLDVELASLAARN